MSVLPARKFLPMSTTSAMVAHHKAGGAFRAFDDQGNETGYGFGLSDAVIRHEAGETVEGLSVAPPIKFPGFTIRPDVYHRTIGEMLPRGATVAIYGSRVAGYHVATSDLDVMYEGCTKEQAVATVQAAVDVPPGAKIDAAEGCNYWHLPCAPYQPVVLTGKCPALKAADSTLLSVAIRMTALGVFVAGHPDSFGFSTANTTGTERVDGLAQVRSALGFAYRRGMRPGSTPLLRRGMEVASPDAYNQMVADENRPSVDWAAQAVQQERDRAAQQAADDATSRDAAICRSNNATRG